VRWFDNHSSSLAPEEGFELSEDTFDDEPLLRSQQPVFRLVTTPSSGFRTVWQSNGRVVARGLAVRAQCIGLG